MSASREKKQRQGAGPSEKALQAQQQQAARKRKTITYTVIGVVAAVLVAALLIWNSGFFQARATAATVGGAKLSTAELSYYYYSARQSAAQFAAYGLSTFDASKSDKDQIYSAEDNTTYRDYFLEAALSSAQRNAALSSQALKDGHTEAEVQEDLDAQIDSVKSAAASNGYSYTAYLRAMYGPYMNAGVLEKVVRQTLLANLAYNDKSTELNNSYSEGDFKAYYNEDDHADTLDTFEYSYLYFTPAAVDTKDADGNDLDEETVNKQKEEALADAKKNAEEALKSLKDGGGVASLASKYDLADNAYADHTAVIGTAAIGSVYREDLLKLDEGESALVENGESGYYVVTFHSRRLVDDPTKDVRHILARAEATTDDDNKLVAPTDEAWAAAKAKMDEIQAAWDAGDKTEDSFANLANEKSDDGDGTTGGLYTRVPKNPAYGSFVSELDTWLYDSSRQPGDVAMIQHSAEEGASSGYYGYHLIYYVGENEPVWMGTVRDTLTTEDRSAWMEELDAGCEAALANGANYLGE